MSDHRLTVHLEDRAQRHARLEAVRLRRERELQIFRETALQAVRASALRAAERQFLALAREMHQVIVEMEQMIPLLIWIWDTAMNKARFQEGCRILEGHLAAVPADEPDHAGVLALYRFAHTDRAAFFRSAVENLQRLSQLDDLFVNDPVQCLRQIHLTQDYVLITGSLLELLYQTALQEGLLDPSQRASLERALQQMRHLEDNLRRQEEHCHTGG